MRDCRWSCSRTILVAALIGASAAFVGCKSSGRGDPEPASVIPLRPGETAFLFPGYPTVLPLAASFTFEKQPPVVRLDEKAVDADWFWLHAAAATPNDGLTPVQRGTTIAARAAAWLSERTGGAQPTWTAIPYIPVDPKARAGAPADRPDSHGPQTPQPGSWVVVIRPPVPLAASLQSNSRHVLKIGDRTLAALVVQHPLQSSSNAATAEWLRPPLPSDAERNSPWFIASLDALSHSPMHRWRARLARGAPMGLPPAFPPTPASSPPSTGSPADTRDDAASTGSSPAIDLFLDPALESLAMHIELQWLAALRRVGESDPAVARRFAAALTQFATFGAGVAVPVFEQDSPTLAALLNELLLPTSGRGDAAARVRVFLDARPDHLAWIADDAPSADATTTEPASIVGVLNVSSDPVAAFADTGAKRTPDELTTIGPSAYRGLTVVHTRGGRRSESSSSRDSSSSPPPPAARDGVVLPIRAGATLFRRRACPFPVSASPPGCTIGPFRPDWTLRSLLASTAALTESTDPGPWATAAYRPAEAEWTTVGRVYLGSAIEAPVTTPGADEAAPQWILYLECLRESHASSKAPGVLDAPPPGFIRVWLGPSTTPTTIYTVSWNGAITDESPRAAAGGHAGALVARVAIESNRLSAWIPLPSSAIEKDGALRLGIERVDERGVRTAWPRSMMPWDAEPARGAIDTRGWKRIER